MQRAQHTVGTQNCMAVNTRKMELPLKESLGKEPNMALSTGKRALFYSPADQAGRLSGWGLIMSEAHTTEPGLKPRMNTSTGTLTTHLTADLPALQLLVLALVIREMEGSRKPISKPRTPCSPPCGGWPRLWGW